VLAPPMGSVGGVQNYTKMLFRASVEILGQDNVRLLAVPSEPETRGDGSVSLNTVTKLRFLIEGLGLAMHWQPKLVICAHIGLAPMARIIKELLGKPYWLVLYGIEVWGPLPTAKQRALRAADRLLSISRFTLDTAISRHALGSPDALILPPALANDDPPPERKLGRILLDPMRPTVLTVGRLSAAERYKGHDVMLEAWPTVLRYISDACYLIVGDGDDRSRLEERARNMGIGASVRFAGSVTSAELHACYEGCQVFAMPARTDVDAAVPRGEGFGIVFLEAMAHGKPVVGPRFGAPAEFIHPGEHGLLVDPLRPTEIAAALVELLREPDRARQMGQKARDWATSQFSYEVFCRRLREMLLAKLSVH